MHVAVVGGSDAGIEAARRCRELDPTVEVSVLVADAFPNLSICGLPYWHSREVPEWSHLAHRSVDAPRVTGMQLRLDHEVTAVDPVNRTLRFTHGGATGELSFDRLIVGTGAYPVCPPSTDLKTSGQQKACSRQRPWVSGSGLPVAAQLASNVRASCEAEPTSGT